MTTADYLYVHIPFCKMICYYCDFVHRVYQEDIVDAYLSSLQKEIESKEISSLKTIYIGGGTPSSIKSELIKDVLNKICEVTNIKNKDNQKYSQVDNKFYTTEYNWHHNRNTKYCTTILYF